MTLAEFIEQRRWDAFHNHQDTAKPYDAGQLDAYRELEQFLHDQLPVDFLERVQDRIERRRKVGPR